MIPVLDVQMMKLRGREMTFMQMKFLKHPGKREFAKFVALIRMMTVFYSVMHVILSTTLIA